MDLQTIIMTVSSLVTGGLLTMLATLGSERRKAKTNATREEMKLQIELAAENAVKTKKIVELHSELLELSKKKHNLEMELLCKRCDEAFCKKRRPPLPWLSAAEMEETAVNAANESV